jgi:elongation factor P
LDFEDVSDELKYFKPNDIVRGLYFNDEFIGIDMPPKVELKVVEAPDAVKGNTTSGAEKKVKLENGLEIFVPLFIKEGETIIVSTEDGKYSERKK